MGELTGNAKPTPHNVLGICQLMEDKAEDYDFDYCSLTQEMRRAFSTTGSDLMKVKELMERKQGPHETFSGYVSDMHNLHITSLAELKREGLRVDRWLRNTGRNMRRSTK